MKVSRLNLEQPGVFSAYLPSTLPPAGAGVRQALALHDGDIAWGAALVEVGAYAVDILSLRYDAGAPAGACERALTDTLVSRAQGSSIQELVYVAQGTRQELESLDDRMLPAGYFPRAGSAQPLEAVLQTLLQNPQVQRLMECRPGPGVGPIEENVLLRLYNRAHTAEAIHLHELDRDTSRCYVEGGEIKAVLHTRRQADTLTVEWLASTASNKEVIRWLLGAALTAAAEHCPPETRVLLSTFPGTPAQLAEKLGFTPVPGGRATRIYTYYLQ